MRNHEAEELELFPEADADEQATVDPEPSKSEQAPDAGATPAPVEQVTADAEQVSVDQPKRVLTTSWSIGPLFSRGCLLSSRIAGPTGIEPLDQRFSGTLPVFTGPVPRQLVKAIRESRRNVFPVLVEWVVEEVTPTDYVALDQVRRLVFADEEELELVLDSPFSDMDPRTLNLETTVDPDAFAGPALEPAEVDEGQSPPDGIADDDRRSLESAPDDAGVDGSSSLKRADRLTGLRAVLGQGVGWAATAAPTLQQLWPESDGDSSDSATWLGAVQAGIGRAAGEDADQELEFRLVRAATELLVSDFGPEIGWPAKEILGQIVERAGGSRSAEDQDVLAEWATRVADLLRGRGDPPKLDDSRGIGFRAVMYLIIRDGDPATILAADRSGPLRVGDEVRLLAMVLAGLRTGLRALPAEFKVPTDATVARSWLEALARVLLHDLGLSDDVPRLVLRHRDAEVLPAHDVELDGRVFFSYSPPVDDLTASVVEGLRERGWPLTVHPSDRRIEVARELAGGAQRTFEIRMPDRRLGQTAVSVSCLVAGLKGRSSRGADGRWGEGGPWLRLLELNADPDHPRVAVNSDSAALVLSRRLRCDDVSEVDAVVDAIEGIAVAAAEMEPLLTDFGILSESEPEPDERGDQNE